MRIAVFGVGMVFAGASLVGLPVPLHDSGALVQEIEHAPVQKTESQEFQSGSVLFVGDIMLGRRIETYMEAHGEGYPFASTTEIIQGHDIAVGNFEGTVPKIHTQTPDLSYQFSIRSSYLRTLANAGFDVLSLANNHAYDYGYTAYEHTRLVCETVHIVCGGHPRDIATSSRAVVAVGSTTVGILFLHTLYQEPDPETLAAAVALLIRESDIQIAYVHWGEEYLTTHTHAQETLGRLLIGYGIDAVIGHHPHVVEDVELYQGKPIIYSLGNFIFDQFFSTEVQTGLGLRMYIEESSITYTLIPLSSIDSRGKPFVGEKDFRNALYERILKPLQDVGDVNLRSGSIRVARD